MNKQPLAAGRNQLKPLVVVLSMHYHPMKNYTYLVIDPATLQAVIVDPAWEMDKVDQALADTQATLQGILVTHSHADHTHLAKPLAEKYGCPIWMPEVESGSNASQLIGRGARPWAVGQMLIEPIFTPGHTPDSTCYLIGDNLFSGDVLFAEGCGICPDTQAAHAMFASLETLKTRLNPQTRIFPGHSYGNVPGKVLSQVLKDNIYLQFSDKHSFAAFRLRAGQNKTKMFTFS